MISQKSYTREDNLSADDSIILSSFYLPPIVYFARIANAPSFKVDLYENYIKQTYRNRCHIYTANGLLALSIPVHKTNGNHTMVKDIQISYLDNWQVNHWRAIESAYNKSPFFLYYKDDLKRIYSNTYKYLWEFNKVLTDFLLKKLKLKKENTFTDDFVWPSDGEEDLRYSIHPKIEQNDIIFPKYYQVFEPKFSFIPNLSIIDLLFNEGPESLSYLQQINFAN
jgi:hypothetical protein